MGAILLSQYGYNGVGLKEVLSSCNVPKGSFYHYFSSKEDYVAKVILHYQEQYVAMLDQQISRSDLSPLEKIRLISETVIEYLNAADNRVGCLLGSITAEVSGDHDGVRKAVQTAYGQWKSRYDKLFAEAQQAGEIRDDVPAEQLADIFWNQWQGALLRMQFERSSEILGQSLSLMLETLYKPK